MAEKKLEILKVLEAEDISKFIKNNSKRSSKSSSRDENLIEKVVKVRGPWLERVKMVKSELEEFDQLKIDSEKGAKRVEEVKAEICKKDQELESIHKVKQTLEERVMDLELKNQNLSLFEKERKRL